MGFVQVHVSAIVIYKEIINMRVEAPYNSISQN